MAKKDTKGLAAPFGSLDSKVDSSKVTDDPEEANEDPAEEATETPDEEAAEEEQEPPEGDISLTDSSGAGINVSLDGLEDPPQLSPGTFTSLVTFKVDNSSEGSAPELELMSMSPPMPAKGQRPTSFDRGGDDAAMNANMDAVLGPQPGPPVPMGA